VLRGAVDDLPIWLLLFIVVAAIVGLLYPFSGDRAIAPEPFRSRGDGIDDPYEVPGPSQ